jgi:hypothetical protein
MAAFSDNRGYNLYNFFYGKYGSVKPLFSFNDEISTKSDFENWKNETLAELKSLLGFDKMQKNKATVVDEGEPFLLEYNGITLTRTRYVLSTQGDLKMPFYVLENTGEKNNMAVVAIHGHGSNGKEGLALCWESPSIEKFNYYYALEFAQRGYTVFIPDLPEAGERCISVGDGGKTASCSDVNNSLISIGLSLQGITVFELLRLTDYISREFDFSKLGCVGFSGGGHTVLWLNAFDERIGFAVVSGYFHSFRDIALYNNWCGCNYIPNLWNYIDLCDLASLAADRALFVETGNKDKLNGRRGMEGTYEMLERANKAFAVFGNKIEFKENDGAHKWYGSCYDWLKKLNR